MSDKDTELKQLRSDISQSLASVALVAARHGLPIGRKAKKRFGSENIHCPCKIIGKNGDRHIRINGKKIGTNFDVYAKCVLDEGWNIAIEKFKCEILTLLNETNPRGHRQALKELEQKEILYAQRITKIVTEYYTKH